MTSAPHHADTASDVLAALVARLRDADLAPTVTELADSLWLAARVAERTEGTAGRPAEPDRTAAAPPARPPGDTAAPRPP
ncbi:hypothetical protein, partial [Streptomyces sp. NPDC047123]|uniref:hypothetical protein n=1 Tax=Streptomyces sp. NPDC047123 TaxID=3155622 RepID=UPI0033E51A86